MNADMFNQDDMRAAETIRSRFQIAPAVGVVLGSGLSELSGALDVEATIPYAEIPGWPVSRVPGHENRMTVGRLAGCPVLMLSGRVHFYEGYDLSQVAFPIRVMRRLGIQSIILTNAAGAVNPDWEPGDLMLIRDHINFMGMAGFSPLRGLNDDAVGPRFPDMSQAYDRDLQARAREAARQTGNSLREGVYACLAGPSFETPAELRFLRMAGVDAVGMSTVPEVVAARHAGMRVLGISGISNKANLDGSTPTSHAEVLAAGARIAPRMASVIQGVLANGGVG
jgi:purine-nucleoside phosphorylase